jgi:hypothetical protein
LNYYRTKYRKVWIVWIILNIIARFMC